MNTVLKGLVFSASLVLISCPLLAGDITGKILFEGNAPKLSRLPMNADPYCMSQHKDPVLSEEVVTNSNGTLRNVFVYIKGVVAGGTHSPAGGPAVLTQNGCLYKPHALGVRVGQEFDVINEDTTLHNVHTMSAKNPPFNVAQPVKGMKLVKKFNNPEIVFVKCEIHRWMGAYVGVFTHPFYAVTGSDGTFTLKGLPAGNYVVEAWHEKYGTQSTNVSLTAEETKSIELKFKGN